MAKIGKTILAPVAKPKRLEAGDLPEGEFFVAMHEYRGMINIVTNKHMYIVGGKERNRLQKVRFTID